MSLEAVLVELRALRAEVKSLKGGSTEPLLYELKDAATALGVSAKTVQRMVATGDLMTVTVRAKRLVPRSELERVATPPRMESSGATQERVRFDAAAAVARLKELRAKRR